MDLKGLLAIFLFLFTHAQISFMTDNVTSNVTRISNVEFKFANCAQRNNTSKDVLRDGSGKLYNRLIYMVKVS